MKKIAVIGAGFGGLSAAIRLANIGFDVDVYEKNSSPGGKANSFLEKGFRFDTGPSLLTMPFLLKQLFDETGENIDDYLSFKKLDIICKYFYEDRTVINAFSDVNKFAKEVEDNTSDSSNDVLNYLNYCRKIYELTADTFLFKSPRKIATYLNLKALKTLMQLKRIDPFRTMHEANAKFFSDKKNIQLFDRYATYNGSNPYLAPATLNIIQHVEYNLGAFVADGGIFSVVNALKKLAEKVGVKIYTDNYVEKIILSNNKVKGVRINNEDKYYDLVISNTDVNFTYKNLLDDSEELTKYSLKPSLSGIIFYWGMKETSDNLEIHNILFSKDYKKEFKDIFERKITPDDPTGYIYISSKFNKDDAPANCENWFVMINAPYNDGQNWEEEIIRTRENVLKKIENTLQKSIRNNIQFEKVYSPIDIENITGSYKGSIYGVSSNSRMSAFLRHPNYSTKYKNLYFCGGSVHPGGGIPLVILSGKIAADLIKEKYI